MKSDVKKLSIIIGLAALTAACNISQDNAGQGIIEQGVADAVNSPTEELVTAQCGRCHLVPNATDVPREHWPAVLNWMGNFLGHKKQDEMVPDPLINPHLVPPQPLISEAEFKQIKEYFLSKAVPQAEMLIESKPQQKLQNFHTVVPSLGIAGDNLITYLAVDDSNQRLYVGSGKENNLVSIDLKRGERTGSVNLGGWPISMEQTGAGIRVGIIGLFDESYQAGLETGDINPLGKVMDVSGLETGEPQTKVIIDGQTVLADVEEQDIDGDGLKDLVLATFGEGWGPIGDGHISVFWQKANSDETQTPSSATEELYTRQQLINRAGPISVEIADFNKDGKLDFMVLLSQGYQQLWLFVNQGERRFEQRLIAEFTPSFGGMAIETADFNNDGELDILLTNGNNAELEEHRPARPYHGFRILQNQGDLTFSERFFYPMHGASHAAIEDFNGDGKLDIVGVSFAPHFKDFSPEVKEFPETFVYLENLGDWNFSVSGFPGDFWGRWSKVAAGDVNLDGKPDIVLGDGAWGPWNTEEEIRKNISLLGDREEYPGLIYLINEQ